MPEFSSARGRSHYISISLKSGFAPDQTFLRYGEAPSQREMYIFQVNNDFHLLQPGITTIALDSSTQVSEQRLKAQLAALTPCWISERLATEKLIQFIHSSLSDIA